MKVKTFALVCFCTTALIGHVRADDIGSEIAGGFIKDLSSVLLGGLKKEMDAKIGEQHAVTDRGFCQVWRSGQLTVQKTCDVKSYCDTGGSCTSKFRWPNGNFSELVFKDQVPVSLNGHPSGLALVGSDQCAQDGSASVFCYTSTAQIAGQTVAIAPASFPPQGSARVNTAGLQPSLQQNYATRELGGSIASKGLPNSFRLPAPQQGANDNGITEVTLPASDTMLPTSPAEGLLAQYVTALQNDATDPQAKVKRCAIGPALLTVYSNDLDQETKNTLQSQMAQDGCS